MTDAPVLDGFWADYFADYLATGKSVEEILNTTVGLHLKRDDVDVDLAICEHMPKLRELWIDVPATRFRNTDVISRLPKLREIWIRTQLTQHDLELMTSSTAVAKLHLTGAPRVESLEFLNSRPNIKSLSLDGVAGITPDDIARLKHVTSLRIARSSESNFGALAAMPKLRGLHIDWPEVDALDNLDFLAAPKLVQFETDIRARDETGLEAVKTRTQLQKLKYPLRDLSVLVNCPKVRSLTIDGSVEHDFTAISELPIVGIGILFAPSQDAVDALMAQAKLVWPHAGFRYRQHWREESQPEPAPITAPTPTPPDEVPAPKRSLWERLFGR